MFTSCAYNNDFNALLSRSPSERQLPLLVQAIQPKPSTQTSIKVAGSLLLLLEAAASC